MANSLVEIFKAGGNIGFSGISYGNMKSDMNGAENNRKMFVAEEFPSDPALKMISVKHGMNVVIAERDDGLESYEADAILTKDANLLVATTFADCPPVLIFFKGEGVVGAIHCSYKTILKGIIYETILAAMKLKADPKNCLTVIGPGICKNCYEIGGDVLYRYAGYEKHLIEKDGKMFVDLKAIIVERMIEARILRENIFDLNKCTFCYEENDQPAFFSARRERLRPPNILAGMAAIYRR